MPKYFCIVLLLITSCSGTQRIAEDANKISDLAHSSKDHFETIEQESSSVSPDVTVISDEAKQGKQEQDEIITLVRDIHLTLPSVEDETPWWAQLITKVMVGLSIIGVIFLLWYTGLGRLIKGMFHSIGWFIPRATRRDADLAVDVLNADNEASFREAVAARRANDPAFDKAFKASKARKG